MLENEAELKHSYEVVARLYRVRDRMSSQDLWTPGGRADAVAGVEGQIHKIEAEIADFLARRPEEVA